MNWREVSRELTTDLGQPSMQSVQCFAIYFDVYDFLHPKIINMSDLDRSPLLISDSCIER